MGTRLLLHSPAKSMTLEVMLFDKDRNEVEVLSWATGQVFRMPYDPAAWAEKGWVRQKIDDGFAEDAPDARLAAFTRQ